MPTIIRIDDSHKYNLSLPLLTLESVTNQLRSIVGTPLPVAVIRNTPIFLH